MQIICTDFCISVAKSHNSKPVTDWFPGQQYSQKCDRLIARTAIFTEMLMNLIPWDGYFCFSWGIFWSSLSEFTKLNSSFRLSLAHFYFMLEKMIVILGMWLGDGTVAILWWMYLGIISVCGIWNWTVLIFCTERDVFNILWKMSPL